MSKSIYQLICDNYKDGKLSDDFSLEEPSSPDEFKWAPGALDGVSVYHMRRSDFDSTATKEMARALKAAARKDYAEADKQFAAFGEKHRAICIVDDLQNYVIKHAKQLDPSSVYNTALNLLLTSSNIESVKIALELLELFGEPDDDVKEIIRRLGLYDEFTIFAVWNMQKWNNGNEEIFHLAQNTYSWGRIHAVERLKPETEEIKFWLLTGGTKNGVANAYSSLTCWQKAEAEKALFGSVTKDEYDGLSTLIEGLLDEGPVPGISELENQEEILLQFLEQSKRFTLTWQDYDVIRSVKLWAEDEDNASAAVLSICDALLDSDSCKDTITAATKIGNALNLANELGISFHADLYQYMKRNFEDCYYSCRYLMDNPDYIDLTMDLFRKKLPLADMVGEPSQGFALGVEFERYNQLEFLLQELADKPLTGMDFMLTGLHSPYVRSRNRALKNLQIWVEQTETPLEELSQELYGAVKELEPKEINDGTKEMITPLLSGEIHFHEPDS